MNKIFIYTSFFLWIVLFYILFLKNYLYIDNNNFSFKDFFHKFKKNFDFKILLLFLIYVIFMFFNNTVVNKLLFITIVLWILSNNNEQVNKIESIKFYILFISLLAFPFEYYVLYHNLTITYIWLLLYLIFCIPLCYIIKYVIKSNT